MEIGSTRVVAPAWKLYFIRSQDPSKSSFNRSRKDDPDVSQLCLCLEIMLDVLRHQRISIRVILPTKILDNRMFDHSIGSPETRCLILFLRHIDKSKTKRRWDAYDHRAKMTFCVSHTTSKKLLSNVNDTETTA